MYEDHAAKRTALTHRLRVVEEPGTICVCAEPPETDDIGVSRANDAEDLDVAATLDQPAAQRVLRLEADDQDRGSRILDRRAKVMQDAPALAAARSFPSA